MAQTKRIAPEALPETLPEDFSAWDGESSSAAPPAESKGPETLSVVPAVRERAQTQVTMFPAQVPPERPKPAPPRTAPSSDPEVDAFLKRLNEVNADLAPVRRQETDNAPRYRSAAVPSPGTATARLEPLQARSAGVEHELIEVFRSGYRQAEKQQTDIEKKPKWGTIGAVSAGVLVLALAVAIPLVVHGRSSSLPHPAATPAQAPADIVEGTSALKPSPSGPATGATATKSSQQPKVDDPQAADSSDDASQAQVSADQMNQQLNAGSLLPQGVHQKATEVAPPPTGFGVAGMEAANDSGAIGSVFKSQSRAKIGPSSVKVSAGVAGGMLIRKMPPEYPQIAKTARVSGTVVLAATITKTGRVSNLQVISGPIMLRQAALDAVRNWVYKPYLLNNQPTEVQTTINVDFNL